MNARQCERFLARAQCLGIPAFERECVAQTDVQIAGEARRSAGGSLESLYGEEQLSFAFDRVAQNRVSSAQTAAHVGFRLGIVSQFLANALYGIVQNVAELDGGALPSQWARPRRTGGEKRIFGELGDALRARGFQPGDVGLVQGDDGSGGKHECEYRGCACGQPTAVKKLRGAIAESEPAGLGGGGGGGG